MTLETSRFSAARYRRRHIKGPTREALFAPLFVLSLFCGCSSPSEPSGPIVLTAEAELQEGTLFARGTVRNIGSEVVELFLDACAAISLRHSKNLDVPAVWTDAEDPRRGDAYPRGCPLVLLVRTLQPGESLSEPFMLHAQVDLSDLPEYVHATIPPLHVYLLIRWSLDEDDLPVERHEADTGLELIFN